ncbi:MAG: hypothetical protein RL481_1590, partial [Pseudomonadota bacterium]
LALFLALPILDFGAVSARDQLARLKSGATKAAEFDWRAMAFDFGPKGRAELAVLAKSGSEFERNSAKTALASENRWSVENDVKVEQSDEWDKNFAFEPSDKVLDKKSKQTLIRDGVCRTPCRVIWLGDNRIAVVGVQRYNDTVTSMLYRRLTQAEADAIHARNRANGDRYSPKPEVMVWQGAYSGPAIGGGSAIKQFDPKSKVEIRSVEMQRVYIDGKPVGDVFEK